MCICVHIHKHAFLLPLNLWLIKFSFIMVPDSPGLDDVHLKFNIIIQSPTPLSYSLSLSVSFPPHPSLKCMSLDANIGDYYWQLNVS